uniref:Uncharacterized protein n=1 Tax=Vespula pensylvanica TaxID=30213 RepID=A0A834N8J0_VESPE|nr:hypothetical protein H0235_016306 [Vespula pensylvanica]
MLEDRKLPLTEQEGYKKICKNRKLAFYTVDKDVIANLKIPCNVVHIATGHVNNIAMILSKHNPFTDVINFQNRQIPFTIDNCKLCDQKSAIPLYAESEKTIWLVIFLYKEHNTDYCHSPPGNIFHLKFNSEMLVLCSTENILREWYSINTNRTEINDVATWSLERGITKIVPDSLYERRHNLQSLIMRAVINSLFINVNKNGQLGDIHGKIFKELFNFSLEIVSEVEEYGKWNPKEKTWSGAMAELYTGYVEISLSDTGHINNMTTVLSKHNPFTDFVNFQ